MIATIVVPRPASDEHDPYYRRYVDLVDGELVPALEGGLAAWLPLVRGLDDDRARHRYAPGKWSVKEVLGHVADTERVFAYRALRIGRGDGTPLPGYDQDVFAAGADFDARPLSERIEDLEAVRAATLSLLRGFGAEALARRGTANERAISARALLWIIAGHERHHAAILRERYGLGASA
jgi:uncharacterized damage-inducible protein DinB